MLGFVLCVLGVLSPSPEHRFKCGMALALDGRHDESEAVLAALDPRTVSHDLYYFARLLNNFALNDKAGAEKYAAHLDDSFTVSLPTRYRALAHMMKHEIRGWAADDLGDISRDMRHAAGRLAKGKADGRTMEVQQGVVDKLAKMIRDAEDAASGAAKKAEDEANNSRGTIPVQGQGQPAPESVVMGTSGQGKVDEKQLRQIAEQWGNLPPEKRARVVEDIKRDLPEKYRPMIEEYFKALNRIHK